MTTPIVAPQPMRPSLKALGKRPESRSRNHLNLKVKTFGLGKPKSYGKVTEDYYLAAMMADERRALCTESDNRVHVTRFPSPFRHLLAPSPTGNARPGVPYVHFATEEVAYYPEELAEVPPLLTRLWAALKKMMAMLTSPMGGEEDRQRLIGEVAQADSEEASDTEA